MEYISLLESKWGKFEQTGHCLNNGKMPFISDLARLNMVFPADNVSGMLSKIHSSFGCDIPKQLADYYQSYNGCRLFFGSLNVFGLQNNPTEIYQPFDIFIENNHITGSLKGKGRENNQIVFVASIGGDYAYGFLKDSPERIIGVKKGSIKLVQEFPDFNSFFEFHFNRLIDEYDTDCRKKHPIKQFQGIPALENVSTDIV